MSIKVVKETDIQSGIKFPDPNKEEFVGIFRVIEDWGRQVYNNLTNTQEVFVIDTGIIVRYGNATPPAGYLDCNGAAVSRTTYAALFAITGTTYGAGDGSTTFNLPNLTASTNYFIIKT